MTDIKATLHLKTGETKQFVSNCGGGDGKVSLLELHKSSVKLQQEINKVLTTLVEEEKSKVSKSDEQSDVNNVDDMEDDDDEEEEDENQISPPDEKRQKT